MKSFVRPTLLIVITAVLGFLAAWVLVGGLIELLIWLARLQ